jgi:hypothetical protein
MLIGVKCELLASKPLSARKVEVKCEKNISEKKKHITTYNQGQSCMRQHYRSKT